MSSRKGNVNKNEEQQESEEDNKQQSPKMNLKLSDIPTIDDGTTDIPPEPFCNLPVKNPYEGQEMLSVPELYREEFPRANFEDLTFEEWNEQQEPKFRIYTVSDFNVESPEISMSQPTAGSKLKPDGTVANFTFSKLKTVGGKGREEACMIHTPSMIAPGGYRKNDTGNGDVTSVKAIMDFNNPHHRQFWFGCMEPILENIACEMMTSPGSWGLDGSRLERLPKGEKPSNSYKRAMEKARDKICKILRVPKISKTQNDDTSTKRIFYMNPLDIPEMTDKEGKKIPKNQAKVYMPGDDERPTTLAALENYCKGFLLKDGKVYLAKPKGFEFSAKLLLSRVTRTSNSSLQIKFASIYIHRFFNIERNNAADKLHLSNLDGRINVDVDRYLGLENFKEVVEEDPTAKTSKRGFNPMVGNETHNDEEEYAPDAESLHDSTSTSNASAPPSTEASTASTSRSKFIPARKFTPLRKPAATEATAEDN